MQNIFSYIISYKHTSDNLVSLRKLIESLLGFHGIEIIVVEQGISPKLPPFTLRGFKYVFIKTPQPYNVSWGYNVGIKYSSSKIVAFSECGIIFNPDDLINALRLLETNEVVIFNEVKQILKDEIHTPVNTLKQLNREYINSYNGIVLYRKGVISSLGGWVEDFFDHNTDYALFQMERDKRLLNSIGICQEIILKTKKREITTQFNETRNKKVYEQLLNMGTDELRKISMNFSNKNGIKNRFDR